MALKINTCTATEPNKIEVTFSEAVVDVDPASDPGSAKNPANYSIELPVVPEVLGQLDADSVAKIEADRAKTVFTITLKQSLLQAGEWLRITVKNVKTQTDQQSFAAGSDTFFTRVQDGDADSNALGDVAINTKGIATSIDEAVSYPVLTEEIGYPPSPIAVPTAMPGAISGGAPLGQIVARAVSDVLGWKVKANDPKGFVGALTASFTCKEVEGHTECNWTPRTYAVQTDLAGGITGAQASLYSRAKEALEQSIPLLDGLYALDPTADKEDVEALREVARSQMTELVNELGMLGGPRVSRVSQYFKLLLEATIAGLPEDTIPTEPDEIGGTLGRLREVLGLNSKTDDFVNSIEDEQDLTNFRILSDYMTSLALSWQSNLRFFGIGTDQPFFGTQLVLLSRQLSVISESVNEVRFSLDSMFIGPSERQTLEIHFPPDSSGTVAVPMFLEDLLSWIYSFASEEGPQLIEAGGKFAVAASFVPLAQSLQAMVEGAQNPTNAGLLPKAYFTGRVQRSLQELADQLEELVTLGLPISHSTVSKVEAVTTAIEQIDTTQLEANFPEIFEILTTLKQRVKTPVKFSRPRFPKFPGSTPAENRSRPRGRARPVRDSGKSD